MLGQDHDKSEKMVRAILKESGTNESTQELIVTIFQKQQEILIALEDIVRNENYHNQYVEKRLDELLEKVDPEEAEKRKRNLCEAGTELRLPSQCLI